MKNNKFRIISNCFKKYHPNNHRLLGGFTLIEMIIVVGVFSLVMATTAELFIAISQVARKTDSSRIATQDARYALETISREVKLAKKVEVGGIGTSNESITVTSKDDVRSKYFLSGGRVMMESPPGGGASAQKALTSENSNITGFNIDDSQLSTRADRLLATITSPININAVAANTLNNRFYFVDNSNWKVHVYNGADNSFITSADLGWQYNGSMTINTATNKLYSSNAAQWKIYVMDAATNVQQPFINPVLVNCFQPAGSDANPQTNKIYFACTTGGFNRILVVNGADDTITATIPVGTRPRDVAVNANTNRIYVANVESNNVSVVDGNTNGVIATIPVGQSPWSIAVNPNNNKIYVNNYNGRSISVIDGDTNTVIKTISFSQSWQNPTDIVVNPTNNRVYSIVYWALFIYDSDTDEKINEISIGPGSSLAVNSATNTIYANANYNAPGPYELKVIETLPIQYFLKLTITAEGKVKDRTGNVPKATLETIVSQRNYNEEQ